MVNNLSSYLILSWLNKLKSEVKRKQSCVTFGPIYKLLYGLDRHSLKLCIEKLCIQYNNLLVFSNKGQSLNIVSTVWGLYCVEEF